MNEYTQLTVSCDFVFTELVLTIGYSLIIENKRLKLPIEYNLLFLYFPSINVPILLYSALATTGFVMA